MRSSEPRRGVIGGRCIIRVSQKALCLHASANLSSIGRPRTSSEQIAESTLTSRTAL
jgi:hypothetical protein